MLISPLTPFDALSWQLAMGVDVCVEKTPQALKAVASREPLVVSEKTPATRHAPPVAVLPSIATAVAEARALADAATTRADCLDGLH